MKEYKVGVIGFGTVGAGVAENLLLNNDCIAKRTGVRPVLHKIADLDIKTDRGIDVPAGVLTTNAAEVIEECDIVVELVGGGIDRDALDIHIDAALDDSLGDFASIGD